MENPADRSVPPAFWADVQTCSCVWRMPYIATALGASCASFRTFSQYKLGSEAQKWTTIASTGELSRALACLADSKTKVMTTAEINIKNAGRAKKTSPLKIPVFLTPHRDCSECEGSCRGGTTWKMSV